MLDQNSFGWNTPKRPPYKKKAPCEQRSDFKVNKPVEQVINQNVEMPHGMKSLPDKALCCILAQSGYGVDSVLNFSCCKLPTAPPFHSAKLS